MNSDVVKLLEGRVGMRTGDRVPGVTVRSGPGRRTHHPEARGDLREGKVFYRYRSPLASVALAREIDQAVERIIDAPMRYPPKRAGIEAGGPGLRFSVLQRISMAIAPAMAPPRSVPTMMSEG
jgi:hypothetical protein